MLRSGTKWAKREVKLLQGSGQPQGKLWSICDHSLLLLFWLKHPGFYTPKMISHCMWVSSWRICMWKSLLQWMLTLKGLRVCLLSICPAIHISTYTHTHTHARTFKLWLLSGPGNSISKTMSTPKYHPPQRIQGFLEYWLWKTVQYWKKFGGFERLDI